MAVVLLCEFPADRQDVRAWVLARAILLRARGEAVFETGGADAAPEPHGREVMALEVASVVNGWCILSEWRRDPLFPAALEARVLETDAMEAALARLP
ncbi:hypothetical protein [Azorhizobium doebereinerae]|uniref:hypothetical protein n=1 Tax=Azorhizobium doebereinerae TaxID=281091 RepID=UPI0004287D55|nr:hypothetical protein [Azorhizobium doebereinerae]